MLHGSSDAFFNGSQETVFSIEMLLLYSVSTSAQMEILVPVSVCKEIVAKLVLNT